MPSPSPPEDPDSLPAARESWRSARALLHHIDTVPVAVVLWDRDFRVARWNSQAERLFGWTGAEVLGRQPGPDWEILPPGEWAAAVGAAIDRARSGTERTVVVTNRNRTKDGSLRWVEWRNSVLTGPDGKLASILSLAIDVTESRAASDAFARSDGWVHAALDGAKMLGWELDLVADRWVTTTDLPDFYGVPRGPDYGDPGEALAAVHPDDVPAVLAGRRRAIETGEPMRYEFRGSVPAADGTPRWFSTRGRVQRDPDGRPLRLVAVTTDVTERKRAEAERATLDRQLLDAQKWESLGVLAGGVAHDFNNILTVILGGAGLARRGLPEFSPAAAYLDQIEEASRRAAELCRQMLAYSGRGHVPTGTTDLNQLTRASSALLAIPAPKTARIRYAFAPDLPPVRADAALVRQVLVNVVMNAVEALGEVPGEVRVETRLVDLAGPIADFALPPAPGRYVRLAVTDTGPGIPPAALSRLFDPFYTTKFAGRGLGMSAVMGITRSHGGGIRVTTAEGSGTTVEVFWPIAAAPLASAAPVARAPDKAVVMDDEIDVH